jgi:arylsulfatase A-like enzyme
LIQPKSINERALVGTIDIMPTLLDLAGIAVPEGLDGRSFKSEIISPETTETNFDVLFSQNQFGRMVRFGQFKYVRSIVYGVTYEVLYDLKNDPLESENLRNNKAFNDTLNKGRKHLDDWLAAADTPLVTRN